MGLPPYSVAALVPIERLPLASHRSSALPRMRSSASRSLLARPPAICGSKARENAARNNARGDYPGKQMQAFDAQRTNAINTAANETIGSQFGPRIAAEEAGDMTARAMRERAALLRAYGRCLSSGRQIRMRGSPQTRLPILLNV